MKKPVDDFFALFNGVKDLPITPWDAVNVASLDCRTQLVVDSSNKVINFVLRKIIRSFRDCTIRLKCKFDLFLAPNSKCFSMTVYKSPNGNYLESKLKFERILWEFYITLFLLLAGCLWVLCYVKTSIEKPKLFSSVLLR